MGQGARKANRGAVNYSARKYSARNGYPPRNGREFDKERQAARKKRRRRRLVRGLAAWAVCLALVALIAFGVTRFVGYLGTSKQRSLRAQGVEAAQKGSYQEAISIFDQALEASGDDKSALTVDILRWRAEAEYQLQDYEAASYTYQLLMERDPDWKCRPGVKLVQLRSGDRAGRPGTNCWPGEGPGCGRSGLRQGRQV